MPQTTYTEAEVNAIIRMAYVTGIRDAIISAQGHALTEDQADELSKRFVLDKRTLKVTAKEVLHAAGALNWQEFSWPRFK